MASVSPVKATEATLESHAAVRKQLVSMFNPQEDQAAVAGRGGKSKAIDAKVKALAEAMAKDGRGSQASSRSSSLGPREVLVVAPKPAPRPVVLTQPSANGSVNADETTGLLAGQKAAEGEEDVEKTCCQKIIDAVCCCFKK